MKPFIRFFASNHTFAILFSTMLILLGIKSIYVTPKNMFPQVDFGAVSIYTIYPNASPEDVELSVTNKIEEQIDGIAGIKEYTSSSLEGVSRVKIELDPDASDEDEVVQKIRDAVNGISDLPNDIDQKPIILRIDSSFFPFLDIGFSSDTLSYSELRKQALIFENKLLALAGVSRVEKFGYKEREFRIEVNPDALSDKQISLTTLAEKIRSRSIRRKLGTLKHETDEKSIVSIAELKSIEAIENVILRSNYAGKLIRVKDVANVQDSFEDSSKEARFNGNNSILFTCFKTESSDMIDIADRVKTFIKTENVANPDIEISYTRDMSRYLANRYSVVKNNGALGLLFLLIVLGTFLNFRTALWVGISIPVIVYAVFWLLPFFVPHIDIISLAAFIIVMGIIVDDGIIISENILQRREQGDSPIDAAVNGVSEVFGPVLTTILTTLMAFAPMFFMPGIIGKFIFVIPLVISLALIVSFFEVTIALPAHIVPGIKNVRTSEEKEAWFTKMKRPFKGLIKKLLNHRYKLVTGYFVLFFLAIGFTIKYKEFVLFPSEQAENIFVVCEMPIGTSFDKTAQTVRQIEQVIGTLPKSELDAFTTKIGLKGRDEDSASESTRHAQMALFLTPYTQRDRTADDIVSSLREASKDIDATIKFNVAGGGPPVGRPLEVRVRHFDNEKRTALTETIISELKTTDGVFDIERNDTLEKSRLVIQFNEERIAKLGFSLTSITKAISTALNGQVVTKVRLDDEDVDFRVILNEKSRYELNTLNKITVSNNQNRLIPLSQLITFKEQPGIPNFYHINGKRTTTIAANVDKTITTPIKLYKALEAKYSNPAKLDGAEVIFGGESEETNKSFQDLFKTFLLALLGIYFLLVLLFNSFLQPLIIVSCIPLGFISVIMAFTLHNQDLGFFAMLGSIGLTGVLVNDSLVLVHRINMLKKQQPNAPLLDIIAQGTADRLRPIILTSLTTVAGVLPLAYGLGGSDPFIAPMGLALGYGLLLSTPLILFYIPCCYLILDSLKTTSTQIKDKIKLLNKS